MNNAVLPNTSTANAKPAWSHSLTKNNTHDFGVVARATKQEHTFEFENTTDGDLYLTSVRASCGCTKPSILTSHVKPGEVAKVKAAYDTLNFYGPRGATVTVSLQKSGSFVEYGELQFTVKGLIRRDVVMNPGEFSFAGLKVAEEAQRTGKLLYAGNPQWRILDVKSSNENISVSFSETERNPATGRVSYELVAKLNGNQRAGSIDDYLTIVTNDKKTTGMPIAVTGSIKELIEVSPIQLGVVNKGQKIRKRLILRAGNAIQIKDIQSSDPRINFEIPKEPKSLHVLTYTLDTSKTGMIDQTITIMTDDPAQPETKVPFSVQIVPATMAGNSSN